MLPARPIARSCTNEEIWDDKPSKISRAMGHREFFFEIDARYIHRIGIGAGLGWRLPATRPDGVDYIKITHNLGTRLLDMRMMHCGGRPPEEAETVRLHQGLQYAELRPTYEKDMYE